MDADGPVRVASSERLRAGGVPDVGEIDEQVGDLLGKANCIKGLGDIAQARYEEALVLYRQVGRLLGEGNCRFRIARCHMAQELPSKAVAGFGEALACYERFGSPYPIGATHFLWAQVCHGGEREAHRDAARQAWRGLDPVVLAGMAASDGIDPADLDAPGPGNVSSDESTKCGM